MAKIKELHAVYGRRWNLDDYESATVNLEATAEVSEEEDATAAAAELFAFLKEQVAAQSLPVLVKRDERRRLRVAEVLDGLPVRLRELAVSFIQSFKTDMPREEVIPGLKEVTANVGRGAVRSEEADADAEE